MASSSRRRRRSSIKTSISISINIAVAMACAATSVVLSWWSQDKDDRILLLKGCVGTTTAAATASAVGADV
jgi:hypothetical protein